MPKITMYTTTTCGYCNMLKNYLSSKKIAFEEVVLDRHPERSAEFIRTCNSMGVPCTHITFDDGREEKILGFDRPRFDQVLGLA